MIRTFATASCSESDRPAHRHVQRRQPHRKTGGPPTHEGLWAGVRRLGAHYAAAGGGGGGFGGLGGGGFGGFGGSMGQPIQLIRSGCASAIRRTDVMEYWIGFTSSVRLDVHGPDHLGPLLGIIGQHLSELLWR